MEHRGVWFPGVPLALGAAILFGASTPFSKLLLGFTNPWLLAGILYFGAGIGLSIFLLIRNLAADVSTETPLSLKDLPWLAAVVAAGGIAGPVLLMFGLPRPTPHPPRCFSTSRASRRWRLPGSFFARTSMPAARRSAAILAGAVLLSWSGEASARAGGAFSSPAPASPGASTTT